MDEVHPGLERRISGAPQGRLTSSSASVQAARMAFLDRCRAKDLTQGTIAWYGQILRDLESFLMARTIEDIARVSTISLREYLANLRTKNSSETTFRTWGALKCFFRFLSSDGLIPTDPMSKVERPRRERRQIKPMSMTQVVSLMSAADVQYRAMLFLMVDSGLRLSEILGLTMEQLNLIERTVTVFGKGRKERTVPVGAASEHALVDYLALRGAGGSTLFIGRSGNALHPRSVQLRLKRYARSVGISGVRVSPHTLRHSFAIQYVRNGGDPFSLQAILGHSTLDMVRNYVNMASRDVCVQHRKFSPMDRLESGGDGRAATQ